MKEQGADIENIKDTVTRIMDQTQLLNENDKKIMKILEDHGVQMQQIQQAGLQIIETLDRQTEALREHGIELNNITATVHHITEQNVKLDQNDLKILA